MAIPVARDVVESLMLKLNDAYTCYTLNLASEIVVRTALTLIQ